MAENLDTPLTIDLMAQIAVLTAQIQEISNKFMTLEVENATLRVEKRNLQEQVQRLAAIESTP